MMSAKFATLGLLQMKVFFITLIKLYYRCGHVPKFDNSGIFMRESYHNLNFIKNLARKSNFF